MTRPRLAIVADDVTGALDTAASAAAAGARTGFVLDASDIAAELDVIACSTDSRHLMPAAAAGRVRAAVRGLAPGGGILFKKVDSTLRGAVAAELLAALAQTGRPRALLCPAVPAQGRTFRKGAVLVGGTPLAQSRASLDLRSPPPAIPIAEALAAVAPGLRIGAWPRGATEPEAGALILADAEDDSDLDRIASWCLARSGEVLPAGAAGLGAAMSRAMFGSPGAPVAPARGSWLAVLGSRTDETARQLDAFRMAGGTVLPAPAGRIVPGAVADALGSAGGGLVAVAAAAPAADPGTVAVRLGAMAAELAGRLQLTGLVLAGGDTALAVLAALRAPGLRLLGEALPGVPLGSAGGAAPLQILAKSGGFGGDDTLLRLAGMLSPNRGVP
ncbi:four-carbon acid sugar kinase family protein [Arenibaculum pallidiluteum]|uniref:four-carbon acid sugar kinase family protein n=1 Tax=Arenibaculum pallidiluteum TaxID=2812559 RepID=UPI001A967C0D|nr:four-carbon acid sugar kinase family protein [Arenibaculum pallidiluteum]